MERFGHLLLAVWREACRHTEIGDALAESASRLFSRLPIDLVLIRASTPLELERGLGDCWEKIDQGCPVWVAYPKGKASSLGETAVREKMRGLGWIDTKVASISAGLTGLRFIKRGREK